MNTHFHSPGQYIKALMDSRGWTQRVLAIILGINETGLNHIIKGARPITATLAIQMGEIFDISPEELLEIQQRYELAQARILTQPDPKRASRAYLFGGLPITEMIKRGWLDADDVRNVSQVESALAKFFGVDSPNDIEILPYAFKKIDTCSLVTPDQLAWIYRVKEIANEMIVAKYSPSVARNALARLKNLLLAPEEVRKVPRILTECGIRYVIVETLSSAKIDGVCFWLNDSSHG